VISLAAGTKVFLASRPVDLRNGFDGLAAKVQQIIGADPFICVGRDYVATSPRITLFHADSRDLRHIRTHHLRLGFGKLESDSNLKANEPVVA
jgi:hypothetical protein